MPGIELEDRTGTPEDMREYQQCIDAVTRLMMGPGLMTLPPELAVLVPQIRRCLIQGQKLTEHLERSIAAARKHTETLGDRPESPTVGATGEVALEEGYGRCNSCRGTTRMPGRCRYCGHTN